MIDQLRSSTSSARLRPVFFVALIVLVFAASYGASTLLSSSAGQSQSAAAPAPSNGGGAARVNPPFRVSDFTLTSKTGEPMSLSNLRGKPVMLMFGYTHCADVCPLTLAHYRQVKDLLGDAGNDVNFLFISVDGTRDTPQVVNDYLARFDPSFFGMIGDPDTLDRISSEYGLVYSVDAPIDDHDHVDGAADDHSHAQDDYSVEHSSPSFLIDRNGFLRTVFFFGANAETMAESLREVLGEDA